MGRPTLVARIRPAAPNALLFSLRRDGLLGGGVSSRTLWGRGGWLCGPFISGANAIRVGGNAPSLGSDRRATAPVSTGGCVAPSRSPPGRVSSDRGRTRAIRMGCITLKGRIQASRRRKRWPSPRDRCGGGSGRNADRHSRPDPFYGPSRGSIPWAIGEALGEAGWR